MPFFKKHNKNSASQSNIELSTSAALLHVTDVRIPAHFKKHGHLRLCITDVDRKNTNIKPHQVYKDKPFERVDAPEIVLAVNRIIAIQGTHLVLELVEHHTFHSNDIVAKPEVSLMDLLSILKQSDQKVVAYLIPNTSVKLGIMQDSLNTLLQQVVLPDSLIECLGRAEAAIGVLSGIADTLSQLHPTAQLVFGLIKSVASILQDQKLCYEKLSDLFEKMGSLLPYFQKIQNLRSFANVQPVIQQILDHMKASLTLVLNDTKSNTLKQFFDFAIWSQQATKFSDLSFKFDKLFGEFNTALQLDMATLQDKLGQFADDSQLTKALEKLNYVEIVPGDQCLEHTKVSTLTDIQDWAHSTVEPIFWLHGPAGTGKSTIAATAASQLERDGRLAAFYTCRRDQKTLGNPLQLLRNICYRLAIVHNPFGQQIAKIIESDKHFGSGGDTIASLFQKLFMKPLSMLTMQPSVVPLVVVIDALDECGGKMDRIALLQCLLELAKNCSWIKVLITSRSNLEIKNQLESSARQSVIDTKDCYLDVETFIRMESLAN
ncbi:hypothetical protein BDN72DRAFT_877375 [Pluteus cervinus]|uniref:Uncharacterized protein n=1 Tax=Pluteus cervinus TaxID=181527 RepID=A0ACD3AYM3_9AGAR|nr:hypothetical protein BDN72DRAFT_877375 [Pluteus cervinus]